MAKRKSTPNRTRFEVFKRDSFKCQYCGRNAPEVVLEVDHINPVANGGDNSLLNLLTSCVECNSGKSDKLLSDGTAVAKQVQQMQLLQERREQLEMLIAWRSGLEEIDADGVKYASDVWASESGVTLTEHGTKELRKLIKKFGLQQTIKAIEIACEQYSDKQVAFNKLGGICFVKSKSETDPHYETVCIVRGILTKRFHVNHNCLPDLIRSARAAGVSPLDIAAIAKSARSWTAFREEIEDLLGQDETGIDG